jgi:Holliday junction DNA helicase RuvA
VFSRISGEVVDLAGDIVRIDVAGLVYDVVMPPSVAAKVPTSGGVTLEIYPSFALDGNSGRFTFFGFSNGIEREFFEALLSVASIGPKSAARAFSAPMARIAEAIENDDQAFLKKLPGIGQQKARDIVAKLQGKVARFLLIQDAPQRAAAAAPKTPPMPEFATEALAVLLQLAYKRGEAEEMIAATLERAPHVSDAETLLAEIYRQRHSNGAPAAEPSRRAAAASPRGSRR